MGETNQHTRPAWLGWSVAAVMAIAAISLGQRAFVAERLARASDTQRELDQVQHQLAKNQWEGERILALGQIAELRRLQDGGAPPHPTAPLPTPSTLAGFEVSRLTAPAGNALAASAIAVWNPASREGLLAVQQLPALSADQDYQLWLIDASTGAMVDGGAFTVDPVTGEGRIEFRPKPAVASPVKFAISREKKGGVPKPQGTMLLVSP